MDTYRLKIKFGEHEFDAEGPVDVVQAQFSAFKEMVAMAPAAPQPKEMPQQNEEVPAGTNQLPHIPLEKIMKADGRIVSLTARSETTEEAALLILLGQKDFRTNEAVTGAELMDGLKQSGYVIPRLDRLTDKLSSDGVVITVGVHRGRRYRLSNQGLARALSIAKEVVATVA